MTPLLVLAGLVALLGALGVVAFPQTIYSALSLLATIGSLAVLFLLLNAQFLFAVQLIIYAGAIVVLFIFIIALLNPENEDRPIVDRRLLAGLAAVVVLTGGVFVLARNGVTFSDSSGFRATQVGAEGATPCDPSAPGTCSDPYHAFGFPADKVNEAGNIQATGGQLFTTFLLPFEITSLLLIVAAVGAVYLTRHRRRQGLALPRGQPGRWSRSVSPPLSPYEPGREEGAQPLLAPGEREQPPAERVTAGERLTS
ncbi:MAG TPA: NADH-quinone oxidoreductase subunit J [Candidatus Sulfotelmatobacter sp.]|nr:NADH-quinone oxidoreductase subunit J [Candidatus Sulfotelmatobacter sp.]